LTEEYNRPKVLPTTTGDGLRHGGPGQETRWCRRNALLFREATEGSFPIAESSLSRARRKDSTLLLRRGTFSTRPWATAFGLKRRRRERWMSQVESILFVCYPKCGEQDTLAPWEMLKSLAWVLSQTPGGPQLEVSLGAFEEGLTIHPNMTDEEEDTMQMGGVINV